jgi:hypothetical protein
MAKKWAVVPVSAMGLEVEGAKPSVGVDELMLFAVKVLGCPVS